MVLNCSIVYYDINQNIAFRSYPLQEVTEKLGRKELTIFRVRHLTNCFMLKDKVKTLY